MKLMTPNSRNTVRAGLAAAAIAVLAACQTVPDNPPALVEARSALQAAEADPAIVSTAALELQQAREAMARAERHWADERDTDEMRSLAHIAAQRIAIARAVAERHVAEARVQQAGVERERVRAEVRTREAQAARQSAVTAQEQVQQQQQQIAASQSQLEQAQSAAQNAAERNRRLEQELQQLQAKQTSRGLVVTLGDVLFDTGQAELRAGAMRSVERIAVALRSQPERRVLIEGHTDAQGGESFNMDLSQRRAEAVQRALQSQGIPLDQIQTRGFGQANPVANNDTPAGRQLNRRVEIVFSDSAGAFALR
ncbi:MAG: OmpA family protein [Burkholderiaceae bacterium]